MTDYSEFTFPSLKCQPSHFFFFFFTTFAKKHTVPLYACKQHPNWPSYIFFPKSSSSNLFPCQNRMTCLQKEWMNLFLSCMWASKSFLWLTHSSHLQQSHNRTPSPTPPPPLLSLPLSLLPRSACWGRHDEELCFVCFSWRREHISRCCRS